MVFLYLTSISSLTNTDTQLVCTSGLQGAGCNVKLRSVALDLGFRSALRNILVKTGRAGLRSSNYRPGLWRRTSRWWFFEACGLRSLMRPRPVRSLGVDERNAAEEAHSVATEVAVVHADFAKLSLAEVTPISTGLSTF